ncbi:CaiB/BaiF CoA transferase family protein [Thermodesulfobacteriota bacterium]
MVDVKAKMLSPFRVLDLSDESGYLCGRILGDLGADVIKVEPPCGDAGRTHGPFYKDDPEPEKSLYWIAYNINKRGITLDINQQTGREILKKMIAKADFIIEAFEPGFMDGLNLGYSELKKINPKIVMTSITPYGQTGPYAHYKASDLEIMAMSGMMSIVGDPDRPPVRVSLPLAPMWTGMHAAMGTLMAHYYRTISGKGQHLDVSSHASMLWALAHAPCFWDITRENTERAGSYVTGRSVTGAKMRAIFPCKDGFVNFIIYGGPSGIRTNHNLALWMEEEGKGSEVLSQRDWKKFNIAMVTQEEIDAMEEPIAEFLKTKTRLEFFQEVIKRDMLGYPVATAKDIREDPQLKERDFWKQIFFPEIGAEITFPGPFFKSTETECGPRLKAPLIGEHNEKVYTELGYTKEDLVVLKQAKVI